jgi:hypothetical protein
MADEIEYSADDIVDADTGDVEKGTDAPKKHLAPDRGVSVLAAHDDPFAPREGKTLAWKNVNMTLVRTYSRPLIGNILCFSQVDSGEKALR